MDRRAIPIRWVHVAGAAVGIVALTTVLVFAVKAGREMGRYLETSTGLTSDGVAAPGDASLPLPDAPPGMAQDAAADAPAATPGGNEDAADLRAAPAVATNSN